MTVRRARRRSVPAGALRCLLVVLLCATQGCAAAQQGVRDDRVIRFFRDLVFGEDFALGRRSTALYRWVEPMRVSVAGITDAAEIAEVERQLQHVSALTGLDAALVDSPADDVNLEIRFAPESDFLVNKEFVRCYVHRQVKANIVRGATIYIGADQPGLLQDCLSHELMHALGFPQHSGILPSSLSPFHEEVYFTRWDDAAVRTLYDHRLKVGMTEAEAMPLVERIIGEKIAEGPGS